MHGTSGGDRERRVRMRAFVGLAAAIAASATVRPVPAGAQPSPFGLPIAEIRVEGNRRVTDHDLLARIHGDRNRPDRTVLRAGQILTPEKVRGTVRTLFQTGYFDDIRVDAEPTEDESGVIVTFTVVERPEVEDVAIEGEDEIDEEKIDEKISLHERSIFSSQAAREDVEKIRELYASEGFFLADVTYEVEARPDDRVRLTYRIRENERVTVREIVFIGNEGLSDDDLLGIMATSPVTMWSFLTDSGRFKQEDFERDLSLIKFFYMDHGYLDVQVAPPAVALSPDRRSISITIPIVEGPVYSLRRVAVVELDQEGNEVDPLGGRAAVRDLVTLGPGDRFSRERIGLDLMAVTRYYKDHGYANVNVDPAVRPVPGATEADLVFEIERGSLVYVERIEIKGNEKTQDEVIRREVQIAEGDLYNETDIELSKRRIEQLGYFETPIGMSTRSGSDERHVIVTFEVKEKPTGTFQVGVGLSSIENFIATAQISQENFLGRGQSLTLAAQLSSIRQLFQLQLSDPYFLGSKWLFGFSVYDSVRVYSNYYRESTGGSLILGYPLTHELRTSLAYQLEHVDISTRGGGTLLGGGYASGVLRDLPLANLFNDGWTSSVRGSVYYDTRNNRIFPTDGQITGVSAEWADPLLLSDIAFTRYTFYTRWYFPLGLGIVFKTNSQVGLILSSDPEGVPIYERYTPGGILDVRGFERFSLGPYLQLPTRLDPNADLIPGGVPVGGNLEVVLNFELEYPIVDRLGLRGVFFVDAGNAFNIEDSICASSSGAPSIFQDPCNVNPVYLRASAGFGFRWISPLGPLRFEWGFPLWLLPGEETYQFEFMVGNFF